MNWRKSQINAISQFGSYISLNFKDINLKVKPGQLIYIFQNEIDDHIHPFIFNKRDGNILWFSGNSNLTWKVGDWVYYRGPIGNGFQSITNYDKFLFISPGEWIGSLNPLIDDALLKNKNVSIVCNNLVSHFNPEFEIMSLDDIDFAIQWAEFIYLEFRLENMQNIHPVLNKIITVGVPCEVFIQTAILCGGTADCMVCAVKTSKGFQQVCKTGPVFRISELVIH
jgi:hypothetical protein